MGIGGCLEAEQALQQDLARGVVQQVGAANDVRDALVGIVDDNREHIRDQRIASLQDEIPARRRDVLAEAPADPVVELQGAGRYRESQRRRRIGRPVRPPAGPRVALFLGQLTPAAAAAVEQSPARQLVESLPVRIPAAGLAQDRLRPFEAECGKSGQDALAGACDFARGVQVLDSDPPAPAAMAGVKVAAKGGQYRSNMQLPGRRGRRRGDRRVRGRDR